MAVGMLEVVELEEVTVVVDLRDGGLVAGGIIEFGNVVDILGPGIASNLPGNRMSSGVNEICIERGQPKDVPVYPDVPSC